MNRESTKSGYMRSLTLICLVLSMVAAGMWIGSVPKDEQEIATELTVPASALDFGKELEQKQFVWSIPIENSSEKDIHVEKFIASCRCASVSPDSVTIPAGESVTVTLELDLTMIDGSGNQEFEHEFGMTLAPICSPPLKSHVGWRIVGRVQSVLLLDRYVAINESNLVHGYDFGGVTVPIKSANVVRDVLVECDESLLSAHITPGDEDCTFKLEAIPRKTLPIGAHKISVQLLPLLDGGYRGPAVPMTVFANVVQGIRASPEVVSAGVVPVGDRVDAPVTLSSRNGRPFQVLDATSSDGPVDIQRDAALSSATTIRYLLRITVGNEGRFSPIVHFHVKPEGELPSYRVDVRIVAIGSPRQLPSK